MPIILITHFAHAINLILFHGWDCVRMHHMTPFGRWACTPGFLPR
jgi:hypothetical protein